MINQDRGRDQSKQTLAINPSCVLVRMNYNQLPLCFLEPHPSSGLEYTSWYLLSTYFVPGITLNSFLFITCINFQDNPV